MLILQYVNILVVVLDRKAYENTSIQNNFLEMSNTLAKIWLMLNWRFKGIPTAKFAKVT